MYKKVTLLLRAKYKTVYFLLLMLERVGSTLGLEYFFSFLISIKSIVMSEHIQTNRGKTTLYYTVYLLDAFMPSCLCRV